MADVISIQTKLKHSKRRQAEIDRKRKILAVQRIFQCTQCAMKCERCGTQVSRPDETPAQGPGHRELPYRFCEGCAEEYIDYIERMKGGGDPDCYWRNEDWLAVWKTWIDYQGARDRYVKSKGFTRLLNELKQPHLE